MSYDIRNVKNITDLIKYFSTNLGWNVDINDFDDIDDISYDFSAEDIGLKEESFAKISSLRQLQPLVDKQEWGIFCIEFASNKFEPSALRKILAKLVPKRRNSYDHAVWDQHDLLFICNWGEDNNRTIGVVHFEDSIKGLPQIKMISCAPALEDFTQINQFENKLSLLTWPRDTSNIDAWRKSWAGAFASSAAYGQVIKDSSTLTVNLAAEAQNIRNRVLDTLNVETANGYVHLLYKKFKDALVHDMTEQQFADMYAQTVVYGLFSARCMDTTQDTFSTEEAVDCIPITNPFLKNLMKDCLGAENRNRLSFDELDVGSVVELLLNTNTELIIQDFNRQTGGGKEDPVIHFYEEFLTAYDKAQKVQRGVFYTPQPVVNFMVRAVDDILKTEFGFKDGLASTETKRIKTTRQSKKLNRDRLRSTIEEYEEVPAVQVLDPATGTGTFIRQVILNIYETFRNNHSGQTDQQICDAWNEYVPKHLLPRINAFELMMAPYAVAHMKLAMVLKDTGYRFESNERLKVCLTNSLEEPGNDSEQGTLWDDPLAAESIEANKVKNNSGINIIIGNPPYSGESSNKGAWITKLMDDYKYEPGTQEKLNEANSKFINDDYIKFIRYAEEQLKSVNQGILCYINPHGYVDNPTFRGVRYNLLSTFSKIYILNLHGNSKKKEKCLDGSKDENVFDIQQGVSINIFVKNKDLTGLSKVFYSDLFGVRDSKYAFLNSSSLENVQFRGVENSHPNYDFNYIKNTKEEIYDKGFSLRDLFPLGTLGVLSKRDSLVVSFTKEELVEKIDFFLKEDVSTSEVCKHYGIPEIDNDKWNADIVRHKLRNIEYQEFFVEEEYRPLDKRYLLYWPEIIARPNMKVLHNLLECKNYAIVTCRQGGASNLEKWDSLYVVDTLCDQNIFRRGGGTVFPLYKTDVLYGEKNIEPNLNEEIISKFETYLSKRMSYPKITDDTFSPEELLGYIFAILSSEKYRNVYKDYLNKDFPKVPYTTNIKLFDLLSRLGMNIIHILIRKADSIHCAKYHGHESVCCSKVWLSEGRLFIDKESYFTGFVNDILEYSIGGNNPILKWIKDRKGKILYCSEINEIKEKIEMIDNLITLSKQIDEIIDPLI